MAAIVTKEFRVLNADNFIDTCANQSIYAFVGKSDRWADTLVASADGDPTTPEDHFRDVQDAHSNMIAMKKIGSSDTIHMLRRVDWTAGATYVPWDDEDENIFDKDFYVITDELKVYKCINLSDTATSVSVKPTHTTIAPVDNGDGYQWKYMYTISGADSDKFLTNSYMPVKTVTLPAGGISELPEADQTQYTNQQSSKTNLTGKIYRISVTNGGSGYNAAPDVIIDGDGQQAQATAIVENGVVTYIEVDNAGTGYSIANVSIVAAVGDTGPGTGATARAILSPENGHGFDPVEELGSYYVCVNTRLEYEEGDGDFIIDNDFRQVGIIANPTDGTNILSNVTLSTLNYLSMASHSNFIPDDIITGQTSGAVAYIDTYDSQTGVIRYHQNSKTGFKSFQNDEGIRRQGSTSDDGRTAVNGGVNTSEYQRFSGKILFLENRDPINRSGQQIEDIKIILEF
jgi:hypothetical protein